MTRQDEIIEIWDAHWAGGTQETEVLAPLHSRFTVEAFSRIRKFIGEKDRHVLDAGCGTGRFSVLIAQAIPGASVIGIDVSPAALGVANRLAAASRCANVNFQEGSAAELKFPGDHFDIVFNEGVVSLFSENGNPTPSQVVGEMTRVTRPGGKVIISVPNRRCYPHTLYKWNLRRRGVPYEYGFEKSYTRAELSHLMRGVGLDVLHTDGYYPAYGFSRLAARVRSPLVRRSLALAAAVVDRLDGRWLSKHFGFYIVAVGVKRGH